ncbi:hypothetical protein D3C80_534910 [compost metagenome]
MRLSVGAAEIVAAGSNLADRIERLTFGRQIDAFRHLLHHAELVLIDHEFFIGRDKTTFQPAGGMENEIGTGEQRHVERVGRFVRGLGVRHL